MNNYCIEEALWISSGFYICESSIDDISVASNFLTPWLQYECQGSRHESHKYSGSYRLGFSFTMYIFGINEVM